MRRDQMTGQHTRERTRTTGDQNRALGIEDPLSGTGHGSGARQTRHRHHRTTHRHLRLTRNQHTRQKTRTDLGARLHVQQHDPVRILRLRGPHQTPHRSTGGIQHTGLAGRDRATRHHDQRRLLEPGRHQPRLQHTEHPAQQPHSTIGIRAVDGLKHRKRRDRTALDQRNHTRRIRHHSSRSVAATGDRDPRQLGPLQPEQRIHTGTGTRGV
ncbi:hypothetical protein AB0B16_39420, partial [Streptomyces tanashiensis]